MPLTQIAYVIDAAMAEGILFRAQEFNGLDQEEELPEEATAEDASDAVLVASSVLASYLAESPYKVRQNLFHVQDQDAGAKEDCIKNA